MAFAETIKNRLCSVILIFSFIFMTACSSGLAPKRLYSESGFSAELRWERSGEEFCVFVNADLPDEDGAREYSMEFLSPESIKGITVRPEKEGLAIGYDGDSANVHDRAIIEYAELLCAEGSFSYTGKTNADGRELIVARKAMKNRECLIYLDSKTGVPVRIEGADGVIDVVWFEYK